MKKSRFITVAILCVVMCGTCFGQDWPQFRGPNRDGKSGETGLLKKWPEGGPKLLWSIENKLGDGFSSVAVVDGRIYTTGMNEDKQEVVFAYDTRGNFKWKTVYGPAWTKSYPSARSTPTVDGDKLYVISGMGLIACLDTATGKQIWAVDTAVKFEGKNIKWGISESVLIHGDKVICTPGGVDATMVALDKMTGETVWTTKGVSEKSAYCAPVYFERNGKKLVVTNIQKSVLIVDPDNGKVVCRIPHEKRHDLAAVSPVYYKGGIYVTAGYTREGMPDRGVMFELASDNSSATQKWTERKLDCHHGGLVFLDGCVYGTDSAIYEPAKLEKPLGTWYCLDLDTGKIKYQAKLVGKGSVIWADGLLYCYGEVGDFALVKPTDGGFEQISSFKVPLGKGNKNQYWAHPAISDGVLYVRNNDALMAYDIKAK